MWAAFGPLVCENDSKLSARREAACGHLPADTDPDLTSFIPVGLLDGQALASAYLDAPRKRTDEAPAEAGVHGSSRARNRNAMRHAVSGHASFEQVDCRADLAISATEP